MLAREIATRLLRHDETAFRRCRHHSGQPACKPPRIERVKTIRILGGVDRINHILLRDVVRHRKLHEKTVNCRFGIQLAYLGKQLGLARLGGQAIFEGVHARFHRREPLVADIDLACRIIADKDHSQAGGQPMLCLEPRNLARHARAKLAREDFAVDKGSLGRSRHEGTSWSG